MDKGHRLLPAVLDYAGTKTPSNIYASVPRSSDISDGFWNITINEVLRAVDSFAWWLRDHYGPSDNFETLTYVGVSDLRYVMFFYAAVKCGYKVLFLSPRNPIVQNASLLEQAKCSKLFHSLELGAFASELQEEIGKEAIQVRAISPLVEWTGSYGRSYPYEKSFEEAKYDPIIVMHSSGSTGLPKLITQNHLFFANLDRPLPPINGRDICGQEMVDSPKGGYYFSSFPCFHLAGFNAMVVCPVFMQPASLVMGYADKPATAQMVYEVMRQKQLRTLHIPPSIIEQLVLIPQALDLIKTLDTIIYSGGPLAKSCGDTLVKYVKLRTRYGSTEIGGIPYLSPEPQDWEFFEFHPAFKARMEFTIDNAYELIVDKDDEADSNRGIGGTLLRELAQYRSRDLFLPHPSKKNLWRFYGRNDDIIVFSNGEKWNPVPSESMILQHPKLSGVLITGNGRFQPVALLEPKESIESADSLIKELWPYIELANKQAQSYGQIFRSKVMVTDPEGLVRAPKGTIVRGATIEKFKDAIVNLYLDTDRQDVSSTISIPYYPQKVLSQILHSCVHQAPLLSNISNDEDFFALGLNSLQAIEVAGLLRSELARHFSQPQLSFITAQFIYSFPTITKLFGSISQILSSVEIRGGRTSDSDTLTALVRKYSMMFTGRRPMKTVISPKKNGLRVILVGSTGFLGRYLLHALLESPILDSVVCLDRDSEAEIKARHTLSAPESTWSRTAFKTVNFDDEILGLRQDDLDIFQADAILYCPWKIDFNYPLSSFEPQIRAITRVAHLTASGARAARIFFVSSISSISNHDLKLGKWRTEEVYRDGAFALPMGYAQSKQVAERILAYVSSRAGIPVSVLRIGQIAGAVNITLKENLGDTTERLQLWNENEWVPTLIRTSKNLGCLPSDLPSVSWIPVDELATIILEILIYDVKCEENLTVYNLVNPHPVAWQSLLPAIRSAIDLPVELVSPEQWTSVLKKHNSENKDEVEEYPALKLLSFFDDLGSQGESLKFMTDQATKASSTFAALDAVKGDWIRKWIHQWDY